MATRRTPRRITEPDQEKENQVPGAPTVTPGCAVTTPSDSDEDRFGEEIEKKYNIEGLNIIDVVYARRENDAALLRITAQETKLKEQGELNARLLRELEALKTHGPTNNAQMVIEDPGKSLTDAQITDALEEERAKNAELQKRLEALSGQKMPDNPEQVPRPAGSAGNNYNIQNEMGLGGSRANREIYLALLRDLGELTHTAAIDWERPWFEIPAGATAKLFDVARAKHPILERYVNDWATEEIVKQFTKNKRRHSYQKNWLDVPAKYAYLKNNSAKRDPSASRKRRAVAAAPKKVASAKKAAKKKEATVAKKTGKPKPKPKPKALVKGKKKVVVESDEDDNDNSMGEAGADDDQDEEE
ncbi:hypothetical protein C8R44DRAFT_877838 [Mycena epipterygia]|nr:hypothetical protein C8R44DRAFT_877838 [Mycena epipterygia]